ncbi:capsule assembly Wzi family protein [Mucilaginibacter sp. NFR10]|uniref:capsule assembly Wzi family protein n=1 Tax=Mucilaginibacter sp. NFR10 TaxID=1566292 RepID=UPI000871A204|nr:capsule assembly Wzi family protein [Mucilaginibacter sp. NFR10]SCW63098.1 Capsule assembly protein Wzi [Mucilaginibacter sp. NFR10]
MKKLVVLLPILLSFFLAKAQNQDVHISLEAQGIVTTNNSVPFWLRANQFGSIPLSGGSGSLIGKIRKDYDTTKTYDWAASFEGRGNAGNNSKFILIEGFVKAHAGIFELKAGRSKDIVGIVDSTLSSGSFPISGNALGIPKISLSIPNYYSIPFFGKLFAVKGTLASGYLGDVKVRTGERPTDFKGYYLENTLYVKIGKPSWRFKFQAGYNHEALWGNEKRVFSRFQLSGSETYWYVLTGKLYQGSKVGNHLGSLDMGAEYRFDGVTVSIYRQNFYDIGALRSLANVTDGLNGITFVNNKPNSDHFYWKKFLFEFLYTANQAGKADSKKTKSGAENYYNNYEYEEGWSYNEVGLGTPFITTVNDVRDSQIGNNKQFFVNNRVLALHTGVQFYAFNWLYTGKFSYSENMGTYDNGTELYRSVGGKIRSPANYGAFKKVHQYSTYFEGIRALKNGYSVGYDLAYDHGGLLYNSFGIILKVSKAFM